MAKVSIIDVASDSLPVVRFKENEKMGKRAICPCPFCKSILKKTMILSEKEDKFNCFSCGKTGDSVDFVIELRGLTREEALDYLNKKSGYKSDFKSIADKEKDSVFIANSIAGKYYYSSLKQNTQAYNYLRDRGITDATIKKFGIGFSKTGLGNCLRTAGVSKETAIESGLIKEAPGYKDKMFNRVMFPIMVKDGNGDTRIAGFGGRLLNYPDPKYPNSPKYMNTKISKAFDKSRVLFAFNYAEKTKRDGFILCEGYMDAISLHQAGFDNAVASLGTAFTPYHAKMLKSLKDNVYLCFDSDDAGVKAKLKAIPVLRNEGLNVKVLSCYPHKDPDEFIKAEGKAAFEKVINKAMGSYEYELIQMKSMCEKENKDFEYEFAHKICDTPQDEYEKYIAVYDKLFSSEGTDAVTEGENVEPGSAYSENNNDTQNTDEFYKHAVDEYEVDIYDEDEIDAER